jgi:hypothetical protein
VPLWAFLIIIKMAKEIKLTQGKVAIVDDEDFEYLNQFKWYVKKDDKNGKFYAEREIRLNGKRKKNSMHRVIVNNNDSKMHTDHCNGDTLDNRRLNLRICTASENAMNQSKNINNTSGYKGVSWDRTKNKWIVKIIANKTRHHVGYFLNKIEAAKAYNDAAIKFHGEFANLNKID